MTSPNQCQFWDCDKTIPYDHFLCYDHWTELLEVEIDPCQACGLFKDVDYDVCGNCYRQTASAWSNQGYGAEPRGNRQSLDEALFEKLRTLRNRLAKANGVQEYMVFSNDTLVEMATVHPTTPEALLAIYGVGPAKMERYGPEFLRLIRDSSGTNTGRGDQPPSPRSGNVQRDDREFPADKDADRFFVYILLLNSGEYYVGQTREIHERLHEHRNNQNRSTKGKEPKL